MPISNRSKTKESVQEMGNQSFDEEYGVNVVELVKYNPAGSIDKDVVNTLSVRVLENSGDPNIIYVGQAKISAATNSALWRVKRINTSSGAVIEWADGNAAFDNIWDNRESLSYS